MPISAIDGCNETHWEQVRTIIEESLESTGIQIDLVSDADDVGVIQKRIIQNIYDNDIVICDVSCKNPNVMFELGMRLAFDKPAVIIKDDVTPYSFDTSPVEHLSYPRGLHYHQIQDFKKKLHLKVISTLEAAKKPDYTTFLKHFGKFVVAKIEEKAVEKDEYILTALQDLRRDIISLRNEQQHPKVKYISSNELFPIEDTLSSKLYSEEDFIKNFVRNLNKDEMEALKDPNSKIFKALLQIFIKEYVSKSVNVKHRHEVMAKDNLINVINRILS